jgi:hypothetical protein
MIFGLILIFIVSGVVTNIYAFRIKSILSQQGLKTYKYYGHLDDLFRFNSITLRSKELTEFRYYLWICTFGYIITLIAGILILYIVS